MLKQFCADKIFLVQIKAGGSALEPLSKKLGDGNEQVRNSLFFFCAVMMLTCGVLKKKGSDVGGDQHSDNNDNDDNDDDSSK